MAADKINWTDKDKLQPKGDPERQWRDTDANAVKDAVNAHANDIDDLSDKVPDAAKILLNNNGASFESADRGLIVQSVTQDSATQITVYLDKLPGVVFVSITPATFDVTGVSYEVDQVDKTVTVIISTVNTPTNPFSDMSISIESY